MLRRMSAVTTGLRGLIARREGSVAIIFALCAIPIFIAAGMAIDIGRAYMVKVRLGAALDAAALAVGSEGGQTPTQLATDLQNYFSANYPSTALGTGVTVAPVPATASLSASTVNYQAQATVPMTLMRLVGVNNITVTATAQTQKTTGLEIAIVLDNTGSMLCGPNDGAPNYSNSTCATGVVASDTTCTNPSNGSRICTLINAATQFVNTLTSAISSAQQLYISVVPYVTTVNVGSALCTGATSCSHITTDTCSGDFTDLRGNIIPTTPITGNTTSGSTTISSISPNTSAIYAGMQIAGTGIPSGATVSTVGSSTSLTISSSATITKTTNSLAVGPSPNLGTAVHLYPPTVTANWTNGSKTITSVSPSTTGIVVGMGITGTGIPAAATVATIVSSTSITISANATSSQTAKTLTINPGNTTSGSATISSMGTTTGIVPGMSISGTGIPAGTTVASIASSTSITISASATSSNTATALTITNLGGNTTSGGSTVTNITSATTPTVGMVASGNGIPANTAVTAASGNFTTGTGQVTLCNSATATNNTALAFYSPVTYDTTNTNTTPNWMGCVVEPTSSAENSSPTGVINASVTDPDYTEPTSWPSWYPLWWPSDSTSNTWTSATVKAQSTATETQGAVVTDWLTLDGPNQGCPVPMIPLTDATTTAGQTTILNTIASMWPRDAGGTQVHIGMIWGWRALSPNGPFTATNGHPLSYSSASSTGWKKIVVLMTDGTEEWPSTDNMTGLGQIADGKIGTTSTTTAVTNLGTRLADVCSNMATSGNFIIYTIGLGSDGASNTDLQNCPGSSGGYFEAATTSNLQTVFQDIAKSLLALRLTQ
jgi:Flp pilus assembly protein TadG